MTRIASTMLVATGMAAIPAVAAAQETVIKVGTVRSIANGAILMAMEKGYFRESGIKLQLEDLQSSATAMASLAQGQLHIIAGGVSAGYFNAQEKNLPIIITVDRVTTPIRHNLMVRADLKDQIRDVKALKGKVIASNAPGSISTYEIGKILAKAGLAFTDVEIKNIPFPQYAVALTNKAVDAALAIPPFTYNLVENNIAVPFAEADEIVEPSPMTIAVNLTNTDWAKSNQQLVRNYYVALMRGVRDYCQAYHGGSIRKELIDLLVKTGTEQRPQLLHKYPWPARNLNGRLNLASLLDVQDWYAQNNFTRMKFTAERLLDGSYVDYANEKLGPFELENKTSSLAGCR
jgi:NitT/TauT family transport system substrate-binding protein